MSAPAAIPSFRLRLTEAAIDAVSGVLRSGMLCGGREVEAAERELAVRAGRRHAAAVSTGTAALHLALLSLGVKAGDPVIVPSYVCSALLNAIRYVGAAPVVHDVAPGSFFLDAAEAAAAAAARGVVVIPELFGYRANAVPCEEAGVPVILDEAMSLGSARRPTSGRARSVSVFSFYATKVITAGQGGLVACDDESISARVRDLREYDKKDDGILRFNYSWTDFQAALAREQLRRLDDAIALRQAAARLYLDKIANPHVIPPPMPPGWNVQRFVVRIEGGAEPFMRHMAKRGIRCVRPVHVPIHRLLGLDPARFPRTETIWREAAALPCFADLSREECLRVVDAVNEYTGARP